MPLSTSSSDRHVPAGAWGRSFWLAVVLAVVILGVWESRVRAKGYYPTLNDTENLWASLRTELDKNPDRTVSIGSSRILFDLDLATYAQYFDTEKPLQLAIPGSNPVSVLEHLAEMESFTGTLLVGVVPALFYAPEGFPVDRSNNAIHHYENWSPSQRSGNFWGIQLERRLAFLNAEDLTLNHVLSWLQVPNRPAAQIPPPFPPYFGALETDRQTRMWEECDWDTPRAIEVQNIWKGLFKPPPPPPGVTPEQFQEMFKQSMEITLQRVEGAVQAIESRGGRVVFIRFPSSHWLRETEKNMSPRPGFWDPIIARSGAPGIHFEDHPELAGFECPEWSHLTAEDSVEFTKRLMPILDRALNGNN